MCSCRRTAGAWLAAFVGWLALAAPALAQGAGASGGGGLTDCDTSVGYIDSAIPRNWLRIRFDAGYLNRQPTRAEFFYAQGGLPGSPGPPLPERNIDSQELN